MGPALIEGSIKGHSLVREAYKTTSKRRRAGEIKGASANSCLLDQIAACGEQLRIGETHAVKEGKQKVR